MALDFQGSQDGTAIVEADINLPITGPTWVLTGGWCYLAAPQAQSRAGIIGLGDSDLSDPAQALRVNATNVAAPWAVTGTQDTVSASPTSTSLSAYLPAATWRWAVAAKMWVGGDGRIFVHGESTGDDGASASRTRDLSTEFLKLRVGTGLPADVNARMSGKLARCYVLLITGNDDAAHQTVKDDVVAQLRAGTPPTAVTGAGVTLFWHDSFVSGARQQVGPGVTIAPGVLVTSEDPAPSTGDAAVSAAIGTVAASPPEPAISAGTMAAVALPAATTTAPEGSAAASSEVAASLPTVSAVAPSATASGAAVADAGWPSVLVTAPAVTGGNDAIAIAGLSAVTVAAPVAAAVVDAPSVGSRYGRWDYGVGYYSAVRYRDAAAVAAVQTGAGAVAWRVRALAGVPELGWSAAAGGIRVQGGSAAPVVSWDAVGGYVLGGTVAGAFTGTVRVDAGSAAHLRLLGGGAPGISWGDSAFWGSPVFERLPQPLSGWSVVGEGAGSWRPIAELVRPWRELRRQQPTVISRDH